MCECVFLESALGKQTAAGVHHSTPVPTIAHTHKSDTNYVNKEQLHPF